MPEEEEKNGEMQEESSMSIEDKVEMIQAEIDELKVLMSDLVEAIKAGADATRGLNEAVQKMIEKIDKPEEANEKQELHDKPREEAKPAENAEDASDLEKPNTATAKQPEYMVKADVKKTINTPRPVMDVGKVDHESDVREFVKSVIEGKVNFGDVGDFVRKRIVRG